MNQLTGKITRRSYFTATENEELSVRKLSVRTPKRFHSAFCLALFRQAKSKSLFAFCSLFAANRRKRKRTNRFNGERGNWKKQTNKNVIATTKTPKMSQFCWDVLSERTDTIWEWTIRSEVDFTNHVTVSVKRRKNTSIFNDLPSLITA